MNTDRNADTGGTRMTNVRYHATATAAGPATAYLHDDGEFRFTRDGAVEFGDKNAAAYAAWVAACRYVTRIPSLVLTPGAAII